MVDVQQDSVPAAVIVRVGIEQAEEVGMGQDTARIGSETLADRDNAFPMPVDHRLDRIGDLDRPHPGIGQGRLGRVAEAQTTDENL